MTSASLLRRNLRYYWRINLAVVLGVATAAGVFACALVVGESVRDSLRRLAFERLGRTDSALISAHLFREELSAAFPDACPMIALEGMAVHQATGRRAAGVMLYGVDDRFWAFHQRAAPALSSGDAAVSEALASELGAAAGDALSLRLEKPADIPAESLHGRRDSSALSSRVVIKAVLAPNRLGEFSLGPRQGAVRTVFVPLGRLQRDLGAPARVNTILTGPGSANVEAAVRDNFTLADLGIRLRFLAPTVALQLETASGLLDDSLAETSVRLASEAGFRVMPVLAYLGNTFRSGGREVPYSLIAALDLTALPGVREGPEDSIVLNEWAARDLQARPGSPVEVEYYVWQPDGRLTTATAHFVVSAVVPIDGLAADQRLAPDYPGITDATNVGDWDPPFPLELERIRPRDEDYWDRYRTTPKAFVPLARGQQLWGSRFGKLSGLRLTPPDPASAADVTVAFEKRLRDTLDPLRSGLSLIPVRAQNLDAAQGATDFGDYFAYFSFFLMASALLLAGLFFRLGVEHRLREIGLLEAVGLSWPRIGRIFHAEGLLLSMAGGILGAAGSAAYAGLILFGLRTWWIDAVGTPRLALSLTAAPVATGAAAGILVAWVVTVLALHRLRDTGPRALLQGSGPVSMRLEPGRTTRASLWAALFWLASLGIVAASYAAAVPPAAAFFGAGLLLLAAALALLRASLQRSLESRLDGSGAVSLRFAFRNAATRPGRTVLSAALVGAAAFLIVSIQTFRRDAAGANDPRSGAGGYPLIAESVRPIYYNLNEPSGRESLNIEGLESVRFTAFRLRPGDDASCLNLFQPRNPRLLGAPEAYLRARRFSFASSLGASPAERDNPWLLLEQDLGDGVIPAIADVNSLQYVLHKKLGDEIVIRSGAGAPVRLRLVASLADSIFQSELIIAERRFLRAFPEQPGWRVYLIEAPESDAAALTARLEDALKDYGFDVTSTSSRLAGFHRVENTYLSTFQSLGALGLLLGTLGLATVLFRNVLERRRELALLAAVGFTPKGLVRLALLESIVILVAGLFAGGACAVVAVAPALAGRGLHTSVWLVAAAPASVAVFGALVSWIAARTALRGSLLDALRAE